MNWETFFFVNITIGKNIGREFGKIESGNIDWENCATTVRYNIMCEYGPVNEIAKNAKPVPTVAAHTYCSKTVKIQIIIIKVNDFFFFL